MYADGPGLHGGGMMMLTAMACGVATLPAWPLYSLWVRLARPWSDEPSVTPG